MCTEDLNVGCAPLLHLHLAITSIDRNLVRFDCRLRRSLVTKTVEAESSTMKPAKARSPLQHKCYFVHREVSRIKEDKNTINNS